MANKKIIIVGVAVTTAFLFGFLYLIWQPILSRENNQKTAKIKKSEVLKQSQVEDYLKQSSQSNDLTSKSFFEAEKIILKIFF